MNPHGLHEDDHYTTAYDLYLIFNACIQNDTFKEIISMSSYTMSIGDAAGNTHSLEVLPTNYYSLGKTEHRRESKFLVVRRERQTRRDAVLFCIVKIWSKTSLYFCDYGSRR